jgi:heme exporter protein A
MIDVPPDKPPPVAPPLELGGVAHRFGRRWILRGLDLRVGSGEVVVVIGANGAGKTTLLRIAATLLRPVRGGGRIGGDDLGSARARGRVGLLGHSPGLYEDLTPRENLRFALAMRGEKADAARVAPLLAAVGLSDHADTRVRRFSTGMRRRLSLARILASRPHLLLMDEPYASLDPEGVSLVNDTIRQVAASGGGVLLATHDLRSGEGITQRILKLDEGILRAGGPDRVAPAGTGVGDLRR